MWVNGSIYVVPRGSLGFYNGGTGCNPCSSSCTGSNAITETIVGTGLYHNTPAFWSAGSSSGYVYLAPLGGVISQYPFQSTCTSGTAPLCNAIHASVDSSGNPVSFRAGVTPAISSNGTSNGILWALDGASVLSTTIKGKLWAFNATTMNHIYNSGQCTQDGIASVNFFVVPTVSNGYVYVGAQSFASSGQGTFYIFGEISNKTCTPD
jgi:hypothetical protein